MSYLRQYIRQILFEVYELSDKDKEFARSMGIDPEDDSGFGSARALGLQSKEQIVQDRKALQNYQDRLRSTPEGKKLIQQFMNGKEVTIMHGINYEGFASSRGIKSKNRVAAAMPFQRWIGKYGRRGKDVLSAVASDKPLGTSFLAGFQNENVAKGFGFIMKGYPVYISRTDVMSQTLGALPAGLVKHQEQSGVAKRPGEDMYNAITEPGFGWSGEVLLDNWTLIGTYMDIVGNNSIAAFEGLARDSINMFKPLPMYIYNDGDFVGIIKDKESLAEVRKKLFGV